MNEYQKGFDEFYLAISTVIEHTSVEANNGHDGLHGKPNNDGKHLGAFENVFTEFQTDDGFGKHDQQEDPALSSNTLTASVRHVCIVLSIKNQEKKNQFLLKIEHWTKNDQKCSLI